MRANFFQWGPILTVAIVGITAYPSVGEPQPKVPSPPTGQWYAVEEREGMSTVLRLQLDDYSSVADIKAVVDSATKGELKGKIESFDFHGSMQVGEQFTTTDGETMVVGQYWAPQFVAARQTQEGWKITIVSGSPFLKEEKAKPQQVGFIEMRVPRKGEGGSVRLFMATEVAYEKGELVSKAPHSAAKLLKIKSFQPPEKKK